jgi:uncharacterized membrane protein
MGRAAHGFVSPRPDVAEHVVKTVETVASLHARAESKLTLHQRAIERLTRALGRPSTVYVTAATAGAWILVNGTLALAGAWALDPPPFMVLTTVASVLCLFMTMIVLTTQNRQAAHVERRAQLELQLSLLQEQKMAKVIALLEELRHDLPEVDDRIDAVAEAMKANVDAQQVMEALEETLEGGAGREKPAASKARGRHGE